jgi:hypothetical protein
LWSRRSRLITRGCRGGVSDLACFVHLHRPVVGNRRSHRRG